MNAIKTEMKIINDVRERNAFDALAPHPMQSWAWGEVRTLMGIRVVRFGEYDGSTLCAVYQMTIHKLPKIPFFIGYVPRSKVPSAAAASFLKQWARKEKIIFIKWEPYVEMDQGIEQLRAISGMRKSRHPLFTEWNQEIDLTPAKEQIQKSFRKTTRYSIRHAEALGVTTKEMSTDEGFQIFSNLYFSTTDRQNYHGHTKRFHKTIWDILGKAGIAHIFVAFHEGKPHAAFEIYYWHDRAYYPYSGSAPENRHVPATQALMWHVIQAAKDHGVNVLDLWGTLPPEYAKKHPWSGFTLFKRGFGSRFVHMTPSFDLVISPVLYHLYSAAYFIRGLVWKGGVM